MINRDDMFQAVMAIRGYILPMGVIVITKEMINFRRHDYYDEFAGNERTHHDY